ncbi:protein phosphatase CheZ [Siccirubricoccus sp. KC 17139]|uniref:Protein phosphatase CheZ n=1 Tax=Siccirubricoccus soli TaxID=2899147 RepID=A0ABT1DDP0_9PROT|nr:protein phosphatase CheZ [Siccirubricoccus soli]MCO6420046.1 protein phosphatase CheZ [Siccirubricoccus soli]MCP2686183.1 protein phosphatase CheZ [Siccirubricoccus soli]
MPDGDTAPDRIEQAVRAVLGTLSGDLTVTETALLAELEGLGREVARAKSEIAALRVDDINHSHIPTATDELDAVVEHTAAATNEILDSCEKLEALQPSLSGEAAEVVGAAVTRIYEACSFQDITGQRIGKVVSALKAIEKRVAAVTQAFGRSGEGAAPAAEQAESAGLTEGQKLANGPQLPGGGTSQEEIDRLLASFD